MKIAAQFLAYLLRNKVQFVFTYSLKMESDTLPPPNVFFRPADVSALIEITALEVKVK